MLRTQAIRYLLVGVANTVTGLTTILILQSMAGFPPYVANACGYACGIVLGFFLNSRWTFQHVNGIRTVVLPYVLALLFSYGVNLAALSLALHLGWRPSLAQATAVMVYSVTFFLLCRSVVFRASNHSVTGSSVAEL